jgi:hypothetical protein
MVHFDHDDDKPREECGVFGIFGNHEASLLTALGLHALQHRGQEACGITSFDGKRFPSERHMGMVGEHFGGDLRARLPGHAAIGHNRYSTQGRPMLRNIQPIFADLAGGGFAVAHNGNLTNAREAAPPAGAGWGDLPVDHGHRGDPSPRCPVQPSAFPRAPDRRPAEDRRRVCPGRPDRQEADRRA